jgi:hypothetical protein
MCSQILSVMFDTSYCLDKSVYFSYPTANADMSQQIITPRQIETEIFDCMRLVHSRSPSRHVIADKATFSQAVRQLC